MERSTLINQRKAKLEKLRSLGVEVYPRRFAQSHPIEEVIDRYSQLPAEELEKKAIKVQLCGRVVSMRGHGKVAFAHIVNGGSKLQVYIRQDKVSPRDYEIYTLLDLGDFIGVEGTLFRTRTGELTVLVGNLHFLAKALRPLPEKWHGLTDVELRYRQRYLDLLANPRTRHIFYLRSRIIKAFREFLDEEGYLEVETPMMQPIPGGATARPFKTFHNALSIDLYLRIAPELYLKRLVVGGLEKVYEINRNFRNEGISTMHNPEFTMLEFYESYSDYNDMMDLTERMLLAVAEKALGESRISYNGRRISLSPPFRRITLRDSLIKWGELSPEQLNSKEELLKIAHGLSLQVEDNISLPKLMNRLFEELVQSNLIEPTFITDYPIEISPLAKQKREDPAIVERFELFIGGLEIANAFSELNDPVEQRRRFEHQLEERAKGDAEAHWMDEDYVNALEHGLPPTGGEGIGIDRLVMLFTDSKSIREVILFPQLRPRGGAGA
ncbi:lysine--tRNA ligase [bacterium (candidate division B38) B3_B38]|nr:MAG: lysine--tRNA ligase [bacterium (candidate division B38) B3_B38]